ncbi:hypothetical protein AZE42_10234, partial [Rhizopogon vesiculosus]
MSDSCHYQPQQPAPKSDTTTNANTNANTYTFAELLPRLQPPRSNLVPRLKSRPPPSFTPGTPPSVNPTLQEVSSSEAIPTFALMTSPCRLSSNTFFLDFRTPLQPHDLSYLSVLPA